MEGLRYSLPLSTDLLPNIIERSILDRMPESLRTHEAWENKFSCTFLKPSSLQNPTYPVTPERRCHYNGHDNNNNKKANQKK